MPDPSRPPLPHDFLPPAPALTVTSDDLTDGGRLPETHVADIMGATGDNLSPHLSWSGGCPPRRSPSRSRASIPTRRPAAASGTGSSSTSRQP